MPRAGRGVGRHRGGRAGRRGGPAVAGPSPGPDLSGIDVVILDKDGTLIDFHAMWGGWARELGTRLEAAARRPVAPDVFAAIGFDPTTGRAAAGGPLAGATMAQIESIVATVLRRWCPSVAAARRATEAAWFVPDPVAATPAGDVRGVLGRLRDAGMRLAVATTDDRDPTDAALRSLGVRDVIEAIVCGDDGFPIKPAPDAVFAICHALQTEPSRCAVVGDAPSDIAMARAAGAGLVVGVLTGVGRAEDLSGADVVVASIDGLLAPNG